jgi:hypothetical protein
MSSKTDLEGRMTITPALNLSGGTISGAAANKPNLRRYTILCRNYPIQTGAILSNHNFHPILSHGFDHELHYLRFYLLEYEQLI